ncbi:MAG: hypothetical protein JOZ05_18910 [Acetobacteraceae bacterium]|nr:hypothetical protein [Acetobacteraceae bacterium]
MRGKLVRLIAAGLTLACLAACGAPTGPAGVPSSTNVNPATGARGGSGASAGNH